MIRRTCSPRRLKLQIAVGSVRDPPANRMRRPSGVNEGPCPQIPSILGDTDVRSTAPVPSPFMSTIDPQEPPGTSSSNTIFEPSGDQEGNHALLSLSESRTRSAPFGLIV